MSVQQLPWEISCGHKNESIRKEEGIYGLKRIVVSQHDYLALKRLGQAGDSFNDVITNLLLMHRHYQQEKEKEDNKRKDKKQEQETATVKAATMDKQ